MNWLARIRQSWQQRAEETTPEPAMDSVALDTPPRNYDVDGALPAGIKVAAAWAWRGLVLAAAIWVLIRVIETLQIVIIPVAISLLLAAMLQPMVSGLRRIGVPPSLAAALVLISGLAVLVGVLTAVIREFIKGFPDLSDNVTEGIGQIRDWLNNGPAHLSNQQIDDALKNLGDAITANRDFTGTALDTATTAFHFLAGFFLVLFTTFFFLKDGSTIWSFLVRLLPGHARAAVDQAGHYSWRTLISYVRTTVLVAAVDALGIGLAVWVLDVPLALPLAALVFLTSFIPIIGATLSGAVAVLVALVDQGPVVALLVLAAVITVQQLEGHVLQPLLMGRAVALHPLAVLLAIGAGAVLAGIMGALVAVPVVAMVNTAVRYLWRHHHGERVGPGEANPPGTKPTDDDAAEREKSTDNKPHPPAPDPATA